MIEHISAVMIVKNEGKRLAKTLDALSAFADVVVYDNGSTDNTLAIAKSYNNARLIQGDFLGFGESKNKAATYAKNDWILSIDADEVLDDELLKQLTTKQLQTRCVYQILRANYYRGKRIKYCWHSKTITRLYHKTVTAFDLKKVHEKINDDGLKTEQLSGLIRHYSYADISDFIQKSDHYSTLFAIDNAGKKTASPTQAFLNAGFSFFKTYFLKRGFLDGYIGLVIAISHANTNFYKYIKLYERNQRQR